MLIAGCAEGEPSAKGEPSVDSTPVIPKIDATDDDVFDVADATTADAMPEAFVDVAPEIASDTAPDTGDTAPLADAADADAPPPWRRTITIDGVNDFSVFDERLTTTSASYDAFVTWDASAVYVGYNGVDIGSGATTTKWLFVYLDSDPGATTGATQSEQYKDQAAGFPTGFGAEAYFAWRTDGTFSQAKRYSGSGWTTVATPGVTVSRSSAFVEMRIPFALLGVSPTKIGVVTFMMNESAGGQWSYAGLYSGSFTDGYYGAPTTVPVKHYLLIDMSSSAPPAATTNRKP